MALRRCKDCGLEAHNEEDLGNFVINNTGKYGRQDLCQPCNNKRRREKWRTDDRYYLFNKLQSMKQRCYNPNSSDYSRYGDRGITIYQEWLDDHESFIEWALANGWKRGLTIDRIDNDCGYSPDNCRWVNMQVQTRNARSNVTDFEKGTRICSSCRIEKPLEEYHRDGSDPTGRRYYCKECVAQQYVARSQIRNLE